MTVAEAFKKVLSLKGESVLQDGKLLYALLADFLPEKDKELRVLKIACGGNIYAPFYACDKTGVSFLKSRAVYRLTEEFILSPEWAERAIDWLLEALGVQEKEVIVPKPPIAPPKQPTKPTTPPVKKAEERVVSQPKQTLPTWLPKQPQPQPIVQPKPILPKAAPAPTTSNQTLKGVCTQNVTVPAYAVCTNEGIVTGNVFVEKNGKFIARGIVSGNISGFGTVEVFGIVNGSIASSITLIKRDGAIINGNRY